MVNQKELQEKILTYRVLQSRLDETIKQRDLLMNKIIEMENTLSSLDEIKKTDKETLFPIGPETFVSGKLTNKEKMLVGIGANIILEKTFDEGKEILKRSKDELERAMKEIQNEINRVSSDLQQLTPELQEMIEKSQKAG
jgi:prefoldin alpha subunit